MNYRAHRLRWFAAITVPAIILSVFAGCGESGSKASADSSARSSDNAELFTIPQDQMAHVQVLTVQPATLTRALRLTGAVAYNSFRTTPVITPVSGPVAGSQSCRDRRSAKATRCFTSPAPISRSFAPIS